MAPIREVKQHGGLHRVRTKLGGDHRATICREQHYYDTAKSAELLCSTGSQVEKKGTGGADQLIYNCKVAS